MAILKAGATFSKVHHFGARYLPLVNFQPATISQPSGAAPNLDLAKLVHPRQVEEVMGFSFCFPTPCDSPCSIAENILQAPSRLLRIPYKNF